MMQHETGSRHEWASVHFISSTKNRKDQKVCFGTAHTCQHAIAGVHHLPHAAAPIAEQQGSDATGTSGEGGGDSAAGDDGSICRSRDGQLGAGVEAVPE